MQRDMPIGSEIVKRTFNRDSDPSFSNDATFYYESNLGIFDVKAGLDANTYETNIPGVGIRIYNPYRGSYVPVKIGPLGPNYAIRYDTFEITLVKTGPISSGIIQAGKIIKGQIAGCSDLYDVSITSGEIVQTACALKTPALNFPMGDVKSSMFGTTVGFIEAYSESVQSLGLECDAGANINVSLVGTQNPDVSESSVLALTGPVEAGVAQGVGVQLLYNGTPLELNKNIVLKKSAGGQETFPIVARYYQTKTTVMPGKANAMATLNVSYQ